jgi:hypothetical protein
VLALLLLELLDPQELLNKELQYIVPILDVELLKLLDVPHLNDLFDYDST